MLLWTDRLAAGREEQSKEEHYLCSPSDSRSLIIVHLTGLGIGQGQKNASRVVILYSNHYVKCQNSSIHRTELL